MICQICGKPKPNYPETQCSESHAQSLYPTQPLYPNSIGGALVDVDSDRIDALEERVGRLEKKIAKLSRKPNLGGRK